jgi:hypothetical protein
VDNVIREGEVAWFGLQHQLSKAEFAYLEMLLSFEPEISYRIDVRLISPKE